VGGEGGAFGVGVAGRLRRGGARQEKAEGQYGANMAS
jgi:hypothetical protein